MRHCKTPRSTIVFRIIKICIVLFFVSSPFTFLGSVWLSDHLAQRSPPHNPRNPSEFFLIYQRIGQERISEIFVIVNAPVGAEAIMEVVADFNRQNITVDMIQTHTISRTFFRETRYLTRDFQIGEPYPPERMPFFWPGPDTVAAISLKIYPASNLSRGNGSKANEENRWQHYLACCGTHSFCSDSGVWIIFFFLRLPLVSICCIGQKGKKDYSPYIMI